MKKIMTSLLVCLLLLSACSSQMQEGNIQESESKPLETADSIEMTDSKNAAEGIIEWDKKQVVIPEVKREYEIWFFADSHIIIPDEAASKEVQTYAAERLPVFTNEKGVAPSQILTAFIQAANEQKPDMVLFGGDILDFPSNANVAFLMEELEKLTVPYVFVMGNHDWTFPWEYMTQEGAAKYRPLYEEVMCGNFVRDVTEESRNGMSVLNSAGNSYSSVVELDDLVILAVDDSSNQVAAEAVENIEYVYGLGKPVILLQHIPFSTEKLIAEAKNYWGNPVTLGMQVHGGIAPNDVSADLYNKVHDDASNIRVVLAGHVHFQYEEQLSAQTVEIITDAAFKGKAIKLQVVSE